MRIALEKLLDVRHLLSGQIGDDGAPDELEKVLKRELGVLSRMCDALLVHHRHELGERHRMPEGLHVPREFSDLEPPSLLIVTARAARVVVEPEDELIVLALLAREWRLVLVLIEELLVEESRMACRALPMMASVQLEPLARSLLRQAVRRSGRGVR